jgi:sigma-B regulation protein RsbU (phosphoserine phosphatase)
MAGIPFPGSPVRLTAAVLAVFIIVTHDPPDLRDVARRVVTYIITTLVIVGFYVAGFTASQTAFNALPRYSPLLVGAGIALLLAIIFTPLLSVVQRWVNRWLNIQEYHPSKTLHAYSEQISNILDMQRLANVAVGLIIEAMDITRGFLFLVDSETPPEGQKSYRLRAVRNEGERQIRILSLPNDHPVVRQLTMEMRPLLQYDLDLLPAFRPVSQAEREWFNNLEAEVYLPIFSKREWIGMLALGAKISGNRYTAEDLVTLSALANQTAVALENARLVENLVQLNTELRQAYRDLDKANRDLERLDPDARRRPRTDQRHRHLRQGPRDRHGGRPRSEVTAPSRRCRPPAVPGHFGPRRRRCRRQPGDPHLPRDEWMKVHARPATTVKFRS